MGGRVVEGTGLENRQTRKRLEGSNPSPSANAVAMLPKAPRADLEREQTSTSAYFKGGSDCGSTMTA
jgi:hypothetical protein